MAQPGTPSHWCVYKHADFHPDKYQKNSATTREETVLPPNLRTWNWEQGQKKKNRIMKVSRTDTASDYVTVKFYMLHSEGIYQSLI